MTNKTNRNDFTDVLSAISNVWVDFDLLMREANLITNKNSQNHIPYDMVRTATGGYRFDLATAGFAREELKVSYDEALKQLTVAGSVVDKQNGGETYVTKKISTRSFTYTWKIDNDVYTIGPVTYKNGILSVVVDKRAQEVGDKKPIVFDITE